MFTSPARAIAPTNASLATVLRSILSEVTPGIRPFSSDSYLPDHLIDQARAALAAHDQRDEATQQAAFNALSTAQWYVGRGQPAAALSRLRRAKSHITAMLEGGN